MPDPLGTILVQRRVITQDQLDLALARQQKGRKPLGRTLTDLGFASGEQILGALAAQFGVPSTRIDAYTMDPAALAAVPERIARRHMALPLFLVDRTLTVAIANPRNLVALDDLRFASGCDISPVVALEDEIAAALDRHYRGQLPLADSGAEGLVVLEENRTLSFDRDAEADQSAAGLVDQILARAAADEASDVHLEPQESALCVRLRVDGVLGHLATLPTALAAAITARIKVLASMDIAEHRLPQDGRFSATIGSRRLDLRVSTYPTVWGEKTVLRLLDRASLPVRLDEIGMAPPLLGVYRDLIHRPEGLVLITGPTGSGKTSTLYASLADLNDRGKNIMTLENPVEYEIEGINQGQANDRIGFDFARGFRAILRQDPDVILIGEIRDTETLEIAIEASLTGHLVFSTLHTNSAVGTITRLLDMGLEPYLIASSLLGVVAQRLVRRLCVTCRRRVEVPPELASLFRADGPPTLYRGAGCRNCHDTGYRGRLGLFELLRMTDDTRRQVLRRAPESEIETALRAEGFVGLRENGLAHVMAGATTLDEVLRTTQVRA